MKQKLFALLLALVLIGTLGGNAITFAQDGASLDGVWITEGYGMVVDISGSDMTAYELTAVSCLPFYSGKLDGNNIPDLGMTINQEEAGRVVIQDALTMSIPALRAPELPEVCANGGTAQSDDPELNFEVFWNTFNENYAFFDLYGVDWQAQYNTYRPQVTPDTTPEELFAILSDLIAPLKDGHTWVTNGVDQFSGGSEPQWLTDNMAELVQYIRNHVVTAEGTAVIGDDLMIYRKLNDTVGYVMITQMADYGEDEGTAAGEAIDEVLNALDGVQTIVVDVRFNGGGYDGVSLAIAGRFADQERLAFTKKTRDGDGWTPLDEFYVKPEGSQQFNGKVIVLTSGVTASAAEIFVMAMEALPNVTVIGEPTAGAHSDMLMRQLPNGWSFSLSDQVYYASDGQVYESLGMPVDISVPMDIDHFLAGQDDALNAALDLAAQE